MRRAGKYILILFAVFFLLIAILLLFTQSSYFKERVKTKLITVVGNQLNLNLEIENLEGNFYSNLAFKNMRFSQNDSTIAHFPSVQLQYNLWDLTNRIITVDSLIIDTPQINIWQINDSTWNLDSVIKEKNTSTQTTEKPFNFEIHALHLCIKDGGVSVSSNSKVIPHKTQNINLIVSGLYSSNASKINLQEFKFTTENPSFVLKNLSGIYTMNNTGIQVDSLHLISGASNIDFNGEYASKENLFSNIDASRIDNDELSIFIPSFKLLCAPAIKASFITKNDSVTAHAELLYNNQSLKANISLNTLNNLLSKKEPVPYLAKLNFNNFRIEDWIETNNIKALINGKAKLSGANVLDPNSNTNISVNLENSKYEDVRFETFTLNGIYNNDNLKARLNVRSDYGEMRINGLLNTISATPSYNAQVQCTDLNLTAFVPEITGTKINGFIEAEGTGFDTKDLLAKAEIYLGNSTLYEFPVDSLQASIRLNKLNLNIDSMQLEAPGASAKGSGRLSLDSLFLESIIYADFKSINIIDSLILLPIEFDSATTTTSILGPVNQLEIAGDVKIYNAVGYSVETEKADAKYLVSLRNDSINVKVNTIATQVQTGPVYWDTTMVNFSYNEDAMSIDANVIWKDTVNASLLTHITIGDTMLFEIPRFEAKTILSAYYLTDTMRVQMLKNETLQIKNFRIKDFNNDDFVLAANGTISSIDTNSFEIEVNQFDLKQLNQIINIPDSLNGMIKTKFGLTGTSQNPSLRGSVAIENPQYGKSSLSSIISSFNYSNQNGFADLTTTDFGNSFHASINAPFSAYIDSLKFIYSLPDSFNANLTIDSLDVSPLTNKLIYSDSISGVINGKVEARGDFNNPQFFGEIDFTNGHFTDKKLGINYNRIHTSIVLDGKSITMDTVLIQQKDGLMSITGNVEFDSTLIKGNIKSSSLQLDANNFFITKHRNYELLIDANSFVKTNNENPEFGGKVKVIRSDVYLPSLMPDTKTDIENDVPLLIRALQDSQDSVLSNDNLVKINSKVKNKKSTLYDNLTGRLNVEIPRNTWIKNDDMRLELSGDLEIVKTGAYFEIFGNIEVIRGQYILYGKKLNVKESQIIFQGGEKLDPTLNISAEYVYRSSDKEKRYLELIITGKVSEPQITFLLDEAEITETDGISVLIFGSTSDEIGYGGQNGMVGSIGSKAVASIITSQLSKTIGTQLNLDMIEVTSTENWQSAAFVVGKYITNDIFITYQRGFGEVEDDEITPEKITVEYEINDKLFLRLESGSSKTSGIDLILKFEQEKVVPSAIQKK